MNDPISQFNCLNCDAEINSESHVVFCNEACLTEYMSDERDLETFLTKHLEKELD